MSYPRPLSLSQIASAPASVEYLENRTLLTVTIVDNLLTVQGTSADDVIIVSLDSHDPSTLVIADNERNYRFDIKQLSLDITAIYLVGDSGNDLLQINEAYGYITFTCRADGGTGDDTIIGAYGNDVFNGGDGDDSIFGGGGTDYITGGAGDDTINGGTGSDYIFGGDGDDYLTGAGGHDQIDGGTGDDNIDGGLGNDYILGGDGDDLLFGYDGNDTIEGGAGNDQCWGENGHDLILGGDGDDDLVGGPGNDTLLGGPGTDLLKGNAGNDQLDPGIGEADSLYGGGGRDIFVVSKTERDTVYDYKQNFDSYGKLTFSKGRKLSDYLLKTFYSKP